MVGDPGEWKGSSMDEHQLTRLMAHIRFEKGEYAINGRMAAPNRLRQLADKLNERPLLAP